MNVNVYSIAEALNAFDTFYENSDSYSVLLNGDYEKGKLLRVLPKLTAEEKGHVNALLDADGRLNRERYFKQYL